MFDKGGFDMTHEFSDAATTAYDLGSHPNQVLAALELDWRRMCGNQLRSSHKTMNPIDMDIALPYAFMLRSTGPATSSIRVTGQKVNRLIGRDPHGESFENFFTEQSRDLAMELMDACFSMPAIVGVPMIAKRRFGRAPIRAYALMLPMLDANSKTTRILGGLVSDISHASNVKEFDIDHKAPLRCDTLEGLFPDRRNRDRAASQKGEHLRLVIDNS